MSTAPAVKRRHALGLPAGSIRALLALALLALLWAMALLPVPNDRPNKLPLDFAYLQIVMVLLIAHFFAGHGNSIGPQVSEGSPLHLPRGSVRFILMVGYLGLAYFLYVNKREFDMPPSGEFFLLVAILFSGFYLGFLLTKILRDKNNQLPYWYQDLQAWVALLAMIGLTVIILIHGFINPNLSDTLKIDPYVLEASLAGVVGLYFGARS
jgi:hypothetical protein